MDAPNELETLLEENRVVRDVEADIYSVLPETSRRHHYDKRATLYDLVVATRLYNSVMWGSSPVEYVALARRAFASSPEGTFLDAGCGSLLFTAAVFLDSKRLIIACDQSLVMLRRARHRLMSLAGSVPENILLLQADLNDLPFRELSFRTILCMNVLHQFTKAADLILKCRTLLTDDGHLYTSSLVLNGRFIGDHYLQALYAIGEFVRPRTYDELQGILNRSLNKQVNCRIKGNMAYATTAKDL